MSDTQKTSPASISGHLCPTGTQGPEPSEHKTLTKLPAAPEAMS